MMDRRTLPEFDPPPGAILALAGALAVAALLVLMARSLDETYAAMVAERRHRRALEMALAYTIAELESAWREADGAEDRGARGVGEGT